MEKIRAPKKLIEVALPLDAINAEAAREKSIRHGHPSTLHLWWARRPLAAARAVLFAQLVNDPGGARGYKAGLTKAQAKEKREKLFDIIKDLVKWENINNPEVLARAQQAIRESWEETCAMNKGKEGFDPAHLPAFHDPFAGGGAIPLEAQRLGLESYASDLNPVAVMINKAMIEIPPRFAGSQPVGPLPQGENPLPLHYQGTEGLAEDIRRYGHWMREQAKARIGHLYPKVRITAEMATSRPDLQAYVGQELTVIAWLWARTVKSPNPAFSHVDVPLVSSFVLSKKAGKEAYVQPIIEGDSYRFEVRMGKPPVGAEKGTKAGGQNANFTCIFSQMPIDGSYVKNQGKAGRMGNKLMAVVCEGPRTRLYLSPDSVQMPPTPNPTWHPQGDVPLHLTGGTCVPYGLDKWHKLFTNRQLVALDTFSALVQETKDEAERAAKAAGFADDGVSLADGGTGAKAYGEAIAVFLSFVIDKCANLGSSITSWMGDRGAFRETFARQAIPMTWDFAEANIFSNSGGNFLTPLDKCVQAIKFFPSCSCEHLQYVEQAPAQTQNISVGKIISTDPPYYNNIGYADLSDFFYVWMRRNLASIYPSLFSTISVPKAEELVATPHRHGGKEQAEEFFMTGMEQSMSHLAESVHSGFPVTIYYAFKASETSSGDTSNTGWETFLQALLRAGFAITGTWPLRTEGAGRLIANGTNALASSIVLVCRKRPDDAAVVSRRHFISELVQAMPDALEDMMGEDEHTSPVAPVDLAQAAIGPGMEIFSQYKAVLKADGSPMSVHEAMIEINRNIAEYLNPSGSSFDAATLFCDAWYQQYGWREGAFGEADVLARAKGTSVDYVKDAAVLHAGGGKVQLVHWRDYPDDYDPATDRNRPVWEACHHLIKALNKGGEQAAGELLAAMEEDTENIRQLAYHLYVQNERRGNAEEARYYNELMTCWNEVEGAAAAHSREHPTPIQDTLNL